MNKIYSKKELIAIIIPLVFEQLLNITVGMADTIMVAHAGQAAISGVSLVDSINILLINLFIALATGGTVIAARSIGQGNHKKALQAADQLLLSITFVSVMIMIFALCLNKIILNGIFGDVEEDVMTNASIYFYITSISFPFLAIMSASSALLRATGNMKTPMFTSIIINIINVVGNAIFINGFSWNAGGAAAATLIARIVGAIILFVVLMNQNRILHYSRKLKLSFHPKMIMDILRIGVPTGIDSCIFQIGKILLQSLTASFGTASIAANAASGSIAGFVQIPGNAISVAFLTIISQLIGRKQYDAVNYYIKRLMIYAHVGIGFVNIFIVLFVKYIAGAYALSDEAFALAVRIILLHSVFSITLWPFSFALPNALRAASDAKYTMIISICSMWIFRIALSFILARSFHLGLTGIWIAMFVDWAFRSAFFLKRVISGRWLEKIKQSEN